MTNRWDAHVYDACFGFVTGYGDDLIDMLDPQPGQVDNGDSETLGMR